MTDSRPHDPFAPPVRAVATPEEEPTGDTSDESAQENQGLPAEEIPELDGLESMRRVDLVELAKQEGVASYGTHADLVERIRRHRQAHG